VFLLEKELSVYHSTQSSPVRIFFHLAILMAFAIGGCSSKDTTPVQTSGDAIDQFLQENPDEAYSSDGSESEESEEDTADE